MKGQSREGRVAHSLTSATSATSTLSERDSASDIAAWVVANGVAPTATCGRAQRKDGRWRVETGGDAALAFFDLASLTKPLTAVAIAQCGDLRHLRLADVLPELASTASADVAIELLLAHRAGLAAHAPLFEPLTRGCAVDRAASLVIAANARRDDARGSTPAEGFAPLYSDLGYVLAGEALARREGAIDAGAAIEARVVDPLGLGGSLGTARALEARGVDVTRVAAPTEIVPWRGGEVRGRVHDENAWALTGSGGSGHAGMFGTIDAVMAFGCAFLDALDGLDARLGSPERLAWLVAPRPGGTLRAGFDGKSAEGSTAGARASASTFGHLGFTGTSLWIDPQAKAVVALLTNRVHPTRGNLAIRTARPLVHDALWPA